MNFIDISLKKMLVLFFIIFMIVFSVWQTLRLKDRVFGPTPPYFTIRLMWENVAGTWYYTIPERIENTQLVVRAFMGGDDGETYVAPTNSSAPRHAEAIPVLEYHRLVQDPDGSNITVKNFRSQMKALADDGWKTITIPEFMAFMRGEKMLSERSIMITFDDGSKDAFYPVDPVLAHYDFGAVAYIIGRSTAIAGTTGSTYYLSPQEISRMIETGRWEIGSHSYDAHRPYSISKPGDLGNFYVDLLWSKENDRLETPEEFALRVREDLERAKRYLETTFRVNIDTVAFPFGEMGTFVAGNYPDGVRVTNSEAAKLYEYGWLQTTRNEYSFNYRGASEREFIVYRIQVDPDWDGADLISVLRRGTPKTLPYASESRVGEGWIAAWGDIRDANGGMLVIANASTTGASTFLDGTRHWKNYEFNAAVEWSSDSLALLTDVEDGNTFRACVFTRGRVLIEAHGVGTEVVYRRVEDARIRPSRSVLGMRSTPDTVSCLWNGEIVASAANMPKLAGGIGFQVWDPSLLKARATVERITVTPR